MVRARTATAAAEDRRRIGNSTTGRLAAPNEAASQPRPHPPTVRSDFKDPIRLVAQGLQHRQGDIIDGRSLGGASLRPAAVGVAAGLVDGAKIFMDSSLIQADASNNSIIKLNSLKSQLNRNTIFNTFNINRLGKNRSTGII